MHRFGLQLSCFSDFKFTSLQTYPRGGVSSTSVAVVAVHCDVLISPTSPVLRCAQRCLLLPASHRCKIQLTRCTPECVLLCDSASYTQVSVSKVEWVRCSQLSFPSLDVASGDSADTYHSSSMIPSRQKKNTKTIGLHQITDITVLN